MPTALITGANRGIGLAMAMRYVAEPGWNVIAVARDIDGAYDLRAFAHAADGRVRIVQADVRDATAIDRLAREVGETPIDLLVNNAGIPGGNEFGAISAGNLSEVFAVNTFAPVLLTQALRRWLVAGGKVVNITSSLGSLMNAAESSTSLTYAMSKAALNMFSVKLAQALRPFGIAVLAMHPGGVRTRMGGDGAPITAEVSADAMLRVIAKFDIEHSGAFVAYDGSVIPW